MNKEWKRKPRAENNMKNNRIEDLFMCHNCNIWLPWYKFTVGKKISLPDNDYKENTYSYMNDDKCRGGRQ